MKHGRYRKMTIVLITSIVVCVSLILMAGPPQVIAADAAPIAWKMHCAFPPSHLFTKAWMAFAEDVGKRTNGQMSIKVYPLSVLGFNMRNVLPALRDNIVPIAEISSSLSEGLLPELKELSIFYILENPENEAKAYAAVRPEIEKVMLDKFKVKVLATCIGDSTEMFLNKKFASLEDVKGLKIRTMGSAMGHQAKMLGLVPTAINSKEVSVALDRGMVDGMYTSLPGFYNGKFYQFLKVANIVNQSYVKLFVGVNAGAFDKLPADIQKALAASGAWLEKEGFSAIRDSEGAKAKENLKAEGVEFYTPPPEILATMKKIGREMAEESAAKAGPDAQRRLSMMLKAAGVQ